MTGLIAGPRVGEQGSAGRRPKITLLVKVLCALLLMPEGTAARQTDPAIESQPVALRFLIGGGLGAANGGIPAFNTCGDVNGEFVMTVQGGIRLRRIMQLEGAMLAHMFTGDGCTAVVIGGQGPAAPKEYSGYPYASTQGRLVLEPGADDNILRPRLFAGGGWIWGNKVGYTAVGAGISTGGARARLVLDATSLRLTAPYQAPFTPAGQQPETFPGREHMILITAGVQYFFGSHLR